MMNIGDGELAVSMEMNQFKMINKDNPCLSQEEADDIIGWLRLGLDSHYGTKPEKKRPEIFFEVTNANENFYIWIRIEDPKE